MARARNDPHDAGEVLLALAIFAKYGNGKLVFEDLGVSWGCDGIYKEGRLQHVSVHEETDIGEEDRAVLKRLGWLFHRSGGHGGVWTLPN